MLRGGTRCMIMRGGSSKGAYFLGADLPRDVAERDELLLAIMGTPDPRQIDGIGGANPLTSKVAIVTPSPDDTADVEYLFLQLGVEQRLVTDRQNCGNLLAGVGPFALERGLIHRGDGEATVRILMRNTDSIAVARFPVIDGILAEQGTATVSGVPGTAAPIHLDFEGIAGATCGSLLPTGSVVDTIDGVECTLIDNGMPVVVLRADAVGIAGDESCAELDADDALRERLEAIRLEAGVAMGLGDVANTTIPKMTMVSPPRSTGDIATRTFIPHRCHDAIGVLGAVSVATAALLPGSTASTVFAGHDREHVVLEHPTGTIDAAVAMQVEDGFPVIERAGIVRTARTLMDGVVYPRRYR